MAVVLRLGLPGEAGSRSLNQSIIEEEDHRRVEVSHERSC
jgi:hypothetical protein